MPRVCSELENRRYLESVLGRCMGRKPGKAADKIEGENKNT